MSVGVIPFWSFNEEPTILGLTYGRWIKGRRNIGVNQIIWSDTGIDGWTSSVSPITGIFSMDFSPEQGLIMAQALGGSVYITSTNSVTWTSRSMLAGITSRGIKWCPSFGSNGLWVANGYNSSSVGIIQTSADGINWTHAFTYSAAHISYALEAGYDGTYYFVDKTPRNSGLTVSVYYTDDGVNFYDGGPMNQSTANNQIPITSLQYVKGIGYYAGGFGQATQGTPTYFSSSLTASWTTVTRTGGPLRIGSAARQPKGATAGLFVSVQFTGGGLSNAAEYSFDGINWTTPTFPFQNGPYDVEYSEELGLFVYTNSFTGTYYSSEDGIIWTSRTNPFGTEYVSVLFCPGVRTTAYKQGADK